MLEIFHNPLFLDSRSGFYEFQLTLVQVRNDSSLFLARLSIAVLVSGFLSSIHSLGQREKEKAGAL